MGVPFDNSHYVGQTASPPCSAAQPWVVVFGGSYSGCYTNQQDAENQYNALSGSTGSGATAMSPLPGNTAPPSPVIPVGVTSGAASTLGGFIAGNSTGLLIVGGALAAFLLLRKH